MNKFRKIFQDKVKVSYFFNNGTTTSDWQENMWVLKQMNNERIIKRRLKEIESSTNLSIVLITRNEIIIYPKTK